MLSGNVKKGWVAKQFRWNGRDESSPKIWFEKDYTWCLETQDTGKHSIDEIGCNKYSFSLKTLWDMGGEHKGPCNF